MENYFHLNIPLRATTGYRKDKKKLLNALPCAKGRSGCLQPVNLSLVVLEISYCIRDSKDE